MKTIAYLRISSGSQDLANQKLAVLDYARQKRFAIDRFIEAQVSSRKGRDQRRIEEFVSARWLRGTAWSSASCPAWAAAWAR
jgi:DNA invertase Pin-like site-specific DNA recombinase